MKTKYFPMSLLPVYVGYCPDKRAWKKEMKRLGGDCVNEPYPDSAGRCTRLRSKDKRLTILIVINSDGNTLAEIVGLIAHEVSHAFDFICQDIGENDPSSEFKAYTIQYLTMMITQAYVKFHGVPPIE